MFVVPQNHQQAAEFVQLETVVVRVVQVALVARLIVEIVAGEVEEGSHQPCRRDTAFYGGSAIHPLRADGRYDDKAAPGPCRPFQTLTDKWRILAVIQTKVDR